MSHPTQRRSADPRTVRTRAKILRAATELFTEQGFDEVSVAMIARKAEVGISSIYVHFPSKAALMDELVGQALDEHAEAFAEARTAPQPMERIVALGRACLRLAADHPAAARALGTLGHDPNALPDGRSRAFLDGLVDDIEAQARALVSDGSLPSEAMHGTVALAIATILGLVDQVGRPDALGIPHETADAALSIGGGWAISGLAAAAAAH